MVTEPKELDFVGRRRGNFTRKRPPHQVGRITKLSPEVSKKICDAVRAGNYLEVAAQYAGVGRSTLMDWLQRGRGTHPTRSAAKVYVDFVEDVEEAQAAAEVAAVLHWRSAMPKDHNAAQKWLKVVHPDRWAEKPQQGNNPYAPVNVQVGIQNRIGVGGDAPPVASTLIATLEADPAALPQAMTLINELGSLISGATPEQLPQPNPEVIDGQFEEAGEDE